MAVLIGKIKEKSNLHHLRLFLLKQWNAACKLFFIKEKSRKNQRNIEEIQSVRFSIRAAFRRQLTRTLFFTPRFSGWKCRKFYKKYTLLKPPGRLLKRLIFAAKICPDVLLLIKRGVARWFSSSCKTTFLFKNQPGFLPFLGWLHPVFLVPEWNKSHLQRYNLIFSRSLKTGKRSILQLPAYCGEPIHNRKGKDTAPGHRAARPRPPGSFIFFWSEICWNQTEKNDPKPCLFHRRPFLLPKRL